jgi:hypothetical protein
VFILIGKLFHDTILLLQYSTQYGRCGTILRLLFSSANGSFKDNSVQAETFDQDQDT